jgi:hypothetical protein
MPIEENVHEIVRTRSRRRTTVFVRLTRYEGKVFMLTRNPIQGGRRCITNLRLTNPTTGNDIPVPIVGAGVMRFVRMMNGFYCYKAQFPISIPIFNLGENVRLSLNLFLMERDEEGFFVTITARRNVWSSPVFSVHARTHV